MEQEVFQKLKVLDFGWGIADPWTIKYLAEHGATVIHIESRTHPDVIRPAPFKDGISGLTAPSILPITTIINMVLASI